MKRIIISLPFAFIFFITVLQLNTCTSKENETTLIILSTTDIHGHVFPWNYYSNIADNRYSMLKAATLIDSVRSIYKHTLLLDAGDWLQGNPFAEYFAREDSDSPYPLIQAANMMNYDAFVIGNHEFNFGIDLLNNRINQANFDILAGNVIDDKTGNIAYTPYIFRNINGFKVAIIGLTTPGSAIWDRPRVEGKLSFIDGVKQGKLLADEVRNLGAEVIVFLIHSGIGPGSSYTSDSVPTENFGQLLVDEIPGIHLLVTGHSHRIIEDTKLYGPANTSGVPVIMAGRWASHVGFSELRLRRNKDGNAVIESVNNIAIPVESFAINSIIYDELKESHERVKYFVNEPIATTNSVWDASDARLYDRAITDLIQHVQMEVTGADISFASVFNTNVKFGPGDITRRDLAALYPFENTLFVKQINGKELKDALEFSVRYYGQTEPGSIPMPSGETPGFNFDVAAGVYYEIDLSKPIGKRIQNLRFKNRIVNHNDTFTLAVNSYRAVGGGDYDMIASAKTISEINTPVRVLIENYLKNKGSIEPEQFAQDNWSILNLPK